MHPPPLPPSNSVEPSVQEQRRTRAESMCIGVLLPHLFVARCWSQVCKRSNAPGPSRCELVQDYPSTGQVWRTPNIGKSPRNPNNWNISGAVHGQMTTHYLGVICRTLPVARYAGVRCSRAATHQARVDRGRVAGELHAALARRVLQALQVGVHRCELRLAGQWPAVAHDSPEEHVYSGRVGLAVLLQHVDGVAEVLRSAQAVAEPLHARSCLNGTSRTVP